MLQTTKLKTEKFIKLRTRDYDRDLSYLLGARNLEPSKANTLCLRSASGRLSLEPSTVHCTAVFGNNQFVVTHVVQRSFSRNISHTNYLPQGGESLGHLREFGSGRGAAV